MMDKILSGRFLLTISCAIVFVWASITGKLETAAMAAIIATVFQAYFTRNDRPNPPSAGIGGAAACLILALMCAPAYAETLPGAKSGIIYAPATTQSIAVNTIKVATIKMVDINAGMARTDGVAVTASIDMSTIKADWLKLPVLDLVNYMNIGAGCAKFTDDTGVACGPYASISWKF